MLSPQAPLPSEVNTEEDPDMSTTVHLSQGTPVSTTPVTDDEVTSSLIAQNMETEVSPVTRQSRITRPRFNAGMTLWGLVNLIEVFWSKFSVL